MSKCVFIIDDDDDVRDVMTFALENEGLKVESFSNPVEAIDRLLMMNSEIFPGLILVDYRMPVMDGLTFIGKMLGDHKTKLGSIPMALCSADDDLKQLGSIPGGVLHLPKPMELEKLVETAKSFCSES